MSKLNLDIFHSETPTPVTVQAENTTSINAEPLADPDGPHPSPKFVSVGFFPEDLRALDEAVLELRKRGHWKASKSAIIRRLITKHRNNLVEVFLEHEPHQP